MSRNRNYSPLRITTLRLPCKSTGQQSVGGNGSLYAREPLHLGSGTKQWLQVEAVFSTSYKQWLISPDTSPSTQPKFISPDLRFGVWTHCHYTECETSFFHYCNPIVLFATKFNDDTIKPVPSPATQMCDNYRQNKNFQSLRNYLMKIILVST